MKTSAGETKGKNSSGIRTGQGKEEGEIVEGRREEE